MKLMDTSVVRVILLKELRDAYRNRWFVLFAVLLGVLALSISLVGLGGLGRLGISGFGRTAASLLHLVMFVVPLMGLLLGAMSISGERERGTLLTILAQPVTPTELLLGKCLGLAGALAGAVVLGFGLVGLLIAFFGGQAGVGGYLAFLGLTLLLGCVSLGLGLVLSVLAPRGAVAVGLATFVWLAMVLLSDLGIIGTAVVLRLRPHQLLWLSLGNPLQVFRLGAIQAMHGSLEFLGPAGRVATHVLGNWLSPIMAGLLVGWTVALVGLALWAFHRRGSSHE